jgi:alkanesulfonate monooxygenase SsuD/methylene tetrahydromethanopterin reductase-like flavin-dependent oxidoreductase (luciferase family)
MLGVGVGHLPPDFALYDVDRNTRLGRLRDLLDVLDAAWAGEPFDIRGRHGRWQGHVTPSPYGGVRPEVVVGAHGPRGLTLAGQRADLWLSDPQRHVDVVARLAGQVRAAAAAAGRTIQTGMFRDGWIGDSRDACEKEWLPHAMAVHRLYFNVGAYLPQFEPWIRQVTSRADFTAAIVAPGRFLYGHGADLRAEIADWRDRTGTSYLAIRMRQPGGPGHEAAMTAIARFGDEVIGPMEGEAA